MVFKKQSNQASFSSSDFSAKSLTTGGSVDVTQVSGFTDIGNVADYTATLYSTVTEISASITAVLTSVVNSTDNALAITTTLPIIILTNTETTTVPTEVAATIAVSGLDTSAGTLSLITAASALRPNSLSIDVSAGGYTFTDDGGGVLTDGVSGTGTVDYTTGAWVLTASEILTIGTDLSAVYDVDYYYEQVVSSVVIRHTVGEDAPNNGTSSAVLSAQVTDPIGVVSFSSASFTLSTDSTPDSNPWNGLGALPGETALETRSRFIDEGVI